MTLWDIIFTIFIKPLELLFEFVFSVSHAVTAKPAISIIVTSLAINFLVLPLYRRADTIQQKAREREKELRPMADHIKKYFKGDERVMIMQTFYRQEHYSPLSSMKSLISLLLQIPFFIAAYQFLSHLPLLEGVKMGPVKDLLAPDALLTIGGVTINVLPVLMTVINIVSSEIYTHGQPFKDKIVLYISAAIFLVLLYNSPAGLVFYWTLNNVFSLCKNIFYKLKNPGFVFKCLCALAGGAGIVILLINRKGLGGRKFGFLALFCVAVVIPFVVHIFPLGKKRKQEPKPLTKGDKMLYLFGSLYMTFLTGLLIPSTVIASSPGDFMYIARLENPSYYVWYTLCIGIGVFFVWLGIFYLLASDRARSIFARIVLVVSGVSTADYLFFGTNFGTISAELQYDEDPVFTRSSMMTNLAVVLGVIIVLLILVKLIPNITRFIVIAAVVASVGLGIVNVFKIGNEYRGYLEKCKVSETPKITLSRNGKNVMVIMLDRAIGCVAPYVFNEGGSALKNQYEGFTCYSNTLSFGSHTNFGAPALFGGYEYTPENLNKRSDMSLVQKHNEALLMMPVIFSSSGYKTTVIDPPYANYSTLPELSIYDDYENIDAYRASGVLNPYTDEILTQSMSVRERNFFLYSIFKISPVMIQPSIYNKGEYRTLDVKYYSDEDFTYHYPQTRENLSKSTGIRAPFMNAYCVMESLNGMTEITDSDQNCFFTMDNDTAHYPNLLQTPDFVPSEHVDNTTYDKIYSLKVYDGVPLRYLKYEQVSHFHVNMAAYKRLGEWFDYLREQGVYDNTRIIIVADHGYDVGYLDSMVFDDLGLDATYVNPVLMVKDFDSHEPFSVSKEFMTNADVPTIAMEGLIENPTNPFTGNPINNNAKYEGEQHVLMSEKWKTTENNGNTFLPGDWYAVHDNIADRSNWSYLGEY